MDRESNGHGIKVRMGVGGYISQELGGVVSVWLINRRVNAGLLYSNGSL